MLEATNYVQNYAGIMYASCQYTTDSLATNPISIICKCHLPIFSYMLTISRWFWQSVLASQHVVLFGDEISPLVFLTHLLSDSILTLFISGSPHERCIMDSWKERTTKTTVKTRNLHVDFACNLYAATAWLVLYMIYLIPLTVCVAFLCLPEFLYNHLHMQCLRKIIFKMGQGHCKSHEPRCSGSKRLWPPKCCQVLFSTRKSLGTTLRSHHIALYSELHTSLQHKAGKGL